MEAGRAVGYRVKLLTLEVGSRGMILDNDMSAMQSIFVATGRTMKVLVSNIIRVTLLESFKIWCSQMFAPNLMYL